MDRNWTAAELQDVLFKAGFVPCDIPACNCGNWHQIGGFKRRFDEIEEVVAEATETNGRTLLDSVKVIITERDAAADEIERLRDVLRETRRFIEWGAPPEALLRRVDAALRGEEE